MAHARVVAESITALIAALRKLDSDLGSTLRRAGGEVDRAMNSVERECHRRRSVLEDARRDLQQAQSALDACRRAESRRGCAAERAEVSRAAGLVVAAEQQLQIGEAARAEMVEVRQRHGRAEARARAMISAPAAAAVTECRKSAADLGGYTQMVQGGAAPVQSGGASTSGGGVEQVDISSIDTSDSTVTGLESFERISASDAAWAVNALDSVVTPGVRVGKDRGYFVERDKREGLSGDRSYAATYDGFYGADRAIKLTQNPDGSYSVANGYHRIWAAQQAGVKVLPARVKER
jgi:hypothetical protein